MSSTAALTDSIAANPATEQISPVATDGQRNPKTVSENAEASVLVADDERQVNDDDLLDDDDFLNGVSDKVLPPEACVATAEALTELILAQTIQRDSTYQVDIDGHTATFKPGDPQLPLTLLAFPGAGNPVIDTKLAIANRNKLCTFGDFTKTMLSPVLLAKPILYLASLIRFESGKLTLPYGVFDVDLSLSNEDARLNPLVKAGIFKVYHSTLGPLKLDWKTPLQKNLEDIERINIKTFLDKISGSMKNQPELKGTSPQDFQLQLRMLINFFRSNLLPLLFTDLDFKQNTLRSLLSPDKISDKSFESVSACFYFFIAQYPAMAEMLSANDRLKEHHKLQLAHLCNLELLMGIEGIAQLANGTSTFDELVPAGKTDGGDLPSKNTVEYEPVKNITRMETFRLKNGDGYEDEDIELYGRSARACDAANLDLLAVKHPHFSPVIEYLRPFVQASFLTAKPFRFPPLLVAGPPGIGKSKFMSDLVQALDVGRNFMHASEFTCGSALVGLQKSWGTSAPGYVTDRLYKTTTFNPVMIFDEVDKIRTNRTSNGTSVDSAFMRLLEPVEARNFHDAYHHMPHDVSSVNWIFTCNSPMEIPYSLATRLQKICVYPPTEAQAIDNIHCSIWKDLLENLQIEDLVYAELNLDVLEFLRELYYDDLQFRKTYQLLQRGCNIAILGTQPGCKALLTLDMLCKKPSKHDKPRPRLLQ